MKKYINPEMKVSLFGKKDICTASGSEIGTTRVNSVEELKNKGEVAEISYNTLGFIF